MLRTVVLRAPAPHAAETAGETAGWTPEPAACADLVVLDGDLLADGTNLAKVAWTIRAGKVIYQKP